MIFSSLRRHAGTKLTCHVALGAWMAFFYYGPQRWPIFPANPAPVLPFDRWIPFQPGWAVVYQSVFIAHTLALWLPGNREAVRQYARLVAAAFACGAGVFWLYPTLSPRPEHSDSLLYRWLISSVDGQRNAFPSLHAAMGLLALHALRNQLRARGIAAGRWQAGLALWWLALLYSTLATRQHSIPDLLAGVFLGVGLLAFHPYLYRTHTAHDPLIASAH